MKRVLNSYREIFFGVHPILPEDGQGVVCPRIAPPG